MVETLERRVGIAGDAVAMPYRHCQWLVAAGASSRGPAGGLTLWSWFSPMSDRDPRPCGSSGDIILLHLGRGEALRQWEGEDLRHVGCTGLVQGTCCVCVLRVVFGGSARHVKVLSTVAALCIEP